MSFLERLELLKKQEEDAKIKLVEKQGYKGRVTKVVNGMTKQNVNMIEVYVELLDPTVLGKTVPIRYVYGDNNISKLQSEIGLNSLRKLGDSFELTSAGKTEQDMVVSLIQGLTGKELNIAVKYNADKKDPSVTYSNYIASKDTYTFNS